MLCIRFRFFGVMLLCRNRVLLICSSVGWVCSYWLSVLLVLYSVG